MKPPRPGCLRWAAPITQSQCPRLRPRRCHRLSEYRARCARPALAQWPPCRCWPPRVEHVHVEVIGGAGGCGSGCLLLQQGAVDACGGVALQTARLAGTSARLADKQGLPDVHGFASLKEWVAQIRPTAGLRWGVGRQGSWHETGFSTGCGCTETVYALSSAHGGHCATLDACQPPRGDTEIPMGLSAHVLRHHARLPAAGMAVPVCHLGRQARSSSHWC